MQQDGPEALAPKRPTQADVARAAGVSQTTVSIVLNRAHPANVRLSEETRQRVLDVLEQTGYIVNPIARSLKGHRTNIIGVFGFEPVFSTAPSSFYLPFMEGIEEAAEVAGRDLLLFTSAARDGSGHHIYRQNENRLRLVDACVLIGNGEPQVELSRLAAEGYPFVFIGRRTAPGVDVPYVTADYRAATIEVVERLHDLDHRELLYVAASHGLPSSVERIEALHDASALLGISSALVYNDADDYPARVVSAIASGVTALLVEPLVDVDALLDAIEQAGYSVPADVSIAVLGDPVGASRSSRYWSGYRLARQEMGRAAVGILLDLMDRTGRVPHLVVPCRPEAGRTIAVRSSSASAGPR